MELLENLGIKELNPVQKKALGTKFIEKNSNLVLASPTGSGKTLVALMAAQKKISEGKKVLYTCPLRALASEQSQTFKKIPNAKVGLSIGDLDSSDQGLINKDIICTTSEKLDSLMRHKSKFIPGVGLLIVDEVHLLDTDRGPTLETIIARFKFLFPNVQIMALSATVPNADEMGEWLNAQVVNMNWRPTKLVKGVYTPNTLFTTNYEKELPDKKEATSDLIDFTLKNEGEALVFCNTRKSAEATAKRLTRITSKYCDKAALLEIADKIENVLESPTKQCKILADCVRQGVAFHNAGLLMKQRSLIEDAFRQKLIKVVTSTPTLALGVNLPAETVVIQSMYRYGVNGIEPLPVGEYFQMIGRAGRPQYNKDGLGVIVAKNINEKEVYWEEYVHGEPNQVLSRIGFEPVLRTQILASIAMNFTNSEEQLEEFLLNTFYAHQYGEVSVIMRQAKNIIEELIEMGFVEKNNYLTATPLGKRVSELYLDPLSAHKLIKNLVDQREDLGYFYVLCNTEEMKPYLRVNKKEEAGMWTKAYSREKELGIDAVNIGYEDYNFLDKYKTALLFEAWCEEKTEQSIMDEFNIAPGILHGRAINMDWVAYSSIELCKVLGYCKTLKDLEKVRRRLKYGVKKELLPLVELKGIGRVKARKLFNASVSVSKLKEMSLDELASLIGRATAAQIKKQLGEHVPASMLKASDKPQTSLKEFQ